MDKAGGLARAAARIKAETRPSRGNLAGAARPDRFNLAPPTEDRSGYVKLSVMLPPALYEALMREAARRTAEDVLRAPEERKENPRLSDVVRDALTVYLASPNGEADNEKLP